jgi:hypothetical protein
MEKYAANLEDIVEERTQQMLEEKQKTDRLLYRMLPSYDYRQTAQFGTIAKHETLFLDR